MEFSFSNDHHLSYCDRYRNDGVTANAYLDRTLRDEGLELKYLQAAPLRLRRISDRGK